MRYSFGLYETGLAGSALLIGFLITAFIVLVVLFESRKKLSPTQKNLIEILNIRYAKGEIAGKRYREIRMIIDDEVSETAAMLIAKERFVRGEMSAEEFFRTRDNIHSAGK